MDENLAFLAILVVILFGFAFFANLSTSSGPLATPPNSDAEYIDIQYNPPENESVYISNWKIANKRGGSFRLGEVTNFPGTGTTPNSSPLIIPQGGIIHVITGRSPRGG